MDKFRVWDGFFWFFFLFAIQYLLCFKRNVWDKQSKFKNMSSNWFSIFSNKESSLEENAGRMVDFFIFILVLVISRRSVRGTRLETSQTMNSSKRNNFLSLAASIFLSTETLETYFLVLKRFIIRKLFSKNDLHLV